MRIQSPLPGQRLALVEFDQPHSYEDRTPPIMDAPLEEATVITSLMDGQDLHRPVLDIDLPVSVERAEERHTVSGYLLTLSAPLSASGAFALAETLDDAGWGIVGVRRRDDAVSVLMTARAFVVPSTTPGHGHLYVDHPTTWEAYQKLLNALVDHGILEPGYVGASEDRGWTCVRLPWVRK